jgi:hypothetical protein
MNFNIFFLLFQEGQQNKFVRSKSGKLILQTFLLLIFVLSVVKLLDTYCCTYYMHNIFTWFQLEIYKY